MSENVEQSIMAGSNDTPLSLKPDGLFMTDIHGYCQKPIMSY